MVMEIKEAIATAQTLKNFYKAFQSLEEFLASVQGFIKVAQTKEKIIVDLDAEIKDLTERKATFESSLVARENEWQTSHEKRAEQIVNKAKSEYASQVATLKTELSGLKKTIDEVKGEIQVLVESRSKIKLDGETEKKAIANEVAKLASQRDELQGHLNSVKKRIAGI